MVWCMRRAAVRLLLHPALALPARRSAAERRSVHTALLSVCGAAGSWQEVGFTSANPATAELIACGVLGLLHLLLLLERRPDIAAQLRSTAGPAQLASSQHWQPPAMSPALLSVHATLWTVQALRSGLMCRAAQRLKSTYTAAGAWPGGDAGVGEHRRPRKCLCVSPWCMLRAHLALRPGPTPTQSAFTLAPWTASSRCGVLRAHRAAQRCRRRCGGQSCAPNPTCGPW